MNTSVLVYEDILVVVFHGMSKDVNVHKFDNMHTKCTILSSRIKLVKYLTKVTKETRTNQQYFELSRNNPE